MQTSKFQSSQVAASWPMSKGLIWGICVPAPIVGSILYYVWKRSYPDAAQYANRASWICWGVFILALFTFATVLG